MKDLSKLIFILTLFYSSFLFSENKNEILFSIEGTAFTSIDLNKRTNYLRLFNEIKEDEEKYNEQLNDLISINIFDIEAKKRNLKIKDDTLNNYLNKIILQYEERKKIKYIDSNLSNKISKEDILMNIKYDLQRQLLLERMLNRYKKNLNLLDNEKTESNPYDLEFKYFIINNENKIIVDTINSELKNQSIDNIKKILSNNSIEYKYYEKNVVNINNLDSQIQKEIKNNNSQFIIYKTDYIILGNIFKKAINNINLKYTFFQVKFEKEKDVKNINFKCENINEIINKQIFEIKKYEKIELEKLNKVIFENLYNINDKVILKNNNQNFLILLCDIYYNYDLVNQYYQNKKIQSLVNEIEQEFVDIKIKEYNISKNVIK